MAALTAFGPTTTGPGEISGFGLVYDQRPGRSFEGLPKTQQADMPTDNVTMRGPSRVTSNDGTLVFSDATMTVSFGTNVDNVTLAADYEFPDDHSLGIIQVRQTGTLNGTRIEGSQSGASGPEGSISGDFYGDDGAVAAGFFSQGGVEDDQYLFGAYIVSSED